MADVDLCEGGLWHASWHGPTVVEINLCSDLHKHWVGDTGFELVLTHADVCVIERGFPL